MTNFMRAGAIVDSEVEQNIAPAVSRLKPDEPYAIFVALKGEVCL
jgi:hypothetical protein